MNEHELRNLMYTAQLPDKGPFVIRYPRGRGVIIDWRNKMEEVKVGTGRKLKDGQQVAVLSIGHIGNNVTKAIEHIEGEHADLKIAHYDMRFLKPLDENILQEVAQRFDRIITVEDGTRNGGLGSAVAEWMEDHQQHPTIVRMGLPDKFIEQGTVDELQHFVGIDAEAIEQEILKIIND